MSQVMDLSSSVRLYQHGSGGGLKLYVSSRQATALNIQKGDLFEIRAVAGSLELRPVKVNVTAQDAADIPLEDLDPFTTTYHAGSGHKFHQVPDCPDVQGNVIHQGRLGARIAAGASPCPTCWVTPEVARHG